ncbi:SxtJ family membrane protein [Maridesulfovibrio salexigens]|uniref:Membrane protein n=1 Tax=Maridesulfovibrio salexigens (strain ATCC 14822 / DSM 2638 / NCIMB 8403 / VKM B-1763) TaxID=526222 RepID=C6BXW5_MARSD|nr:SxtJ family membrane protein [Maridesulfovibrio salexigens]ACS78673.1 membrane protein [Maridesulfovibrio salexigens DSM 2638]
MSEPNKIIVGKKEASDTGMAMVLICLIVGFVYKDWNWIFGAGGLLIVNMTWSMAFKYPAKLWLTFSQLLGSFMSKVILTLVFFVVVTPLAILRRLFGHDPMLLKKWKAKDESAFVTRNHKYNSEEIEDPF